jgi:hypothetical protein
MPEQAAGRIREEDTSGSFSIPAPRPAERPVRPSIVLTTAGPPATSARRAALSGAAVRVQPLTEPGPVAGSYVTVRGAMVAMFGIFLFCSLVAGWLNFGVLTGLGYVASCVLAPFLVRRHAQLHVVVAPPAIFMAVVVLTQVLTAQGTSRHGRVLSVLEGTALTLAAVAPWLFAGTLLGVWASAQRGLRQCMRELLAEFRGEAVTAAGDRAQESTQASGPAQESATAEGPARQAARKKF